MLDADTVNEQNREDLALLTRAALEAGDIAMRFFKKDPQVWMKQGTSPVSEADFAVNERLQQLLMQERPDYGWLSEETEDTPDRLKHDRIFVVDPIDGTRGFIDGARQWCISIAVVDGNRPVAGVLQCPVLDETFEASIGNGAFLNGKRLTAVKSPTTKRITGPRKFLKRADTLLDETFEKAPFVPSLAYRIAMVASGQLEAAFARGSARDWDLAAADLIVHEAGGKLTDFENRQLSYNEDETRHGVLLASRENLHKQLLEVAIPVSEIS